MKPFFKWTGIGCGSLVGILVLIGLIGALAGGNQSSTTAPAASPSSSAPATAKVGSQASTAPLRMSPPTVTPAALPGLGQRVGSSNFAFTVTGARFFPDLGNFSKTEPQGLFFVLTVTIENISNKSQRLNAWDLKLHDGQGRQYDTSSEGSTALLGTEPEPFWLGSTIQPGLSKTVRVVFDVVPAASGLQLEVQGGKRIAVR